MSVRFFNFLFQHSVNKNYFATKALAAKRNTKIRINNALHPILGESLCLCALVANNYPM
jgi:hypothetical protein